MTKKEQALNIFLCAVCLCAVCFAVLRPKVAAEAAFSALSLCATRVVPSLFLFMAAAKMLAKCGFAAIFSRITHGAFERLFGVSPCGAAVILLGLLSGYPAGAVAAGELLAAGEMERAEAERILPFATAASPAFLIGAVGSMFGSARIGTALFLAQTLSALMLLFFTRAKGVAFAAVPKRQKRGSALSALAASVKESGLSSLAVCSFITFFSVFSAMIQHVFSLSGMAAALFAGVMEISGGFARLASLGENYFICGAILGFGGFSVFMQTADALGDTGVHMGRYLLCKFLQALLCGTLAKIFDKILPSAGQTETIFLFGREQGKVDVLLQSALDFFIILAFCAIVLAVFLKILGFFFKKIIKISKKLWKKSSE